MHRTDFAGTVRGIVETPQGGVRVPAALTRVGVLPYEDAAGNRWRELRPADEVFDADSLATLRDAPVTVLHPPGLVTGDTWDEVAVGHNAGPVSTEADRLVVTDGLVVQSAPAAARVRSGELCETSAGYTCDLDETPGVDPVDGPYDKIQRRIRYNHVALGPQGWARGGREMALRMDGAAVEATELPAVTGTRTDSAGGPAKDTRTMKTIKIKGQTFRLDADDEMVAAQKKADEMEGELASAVDKSAEVDAKLEAASKALIEAAQTVAALQVQLSAAKAPAEAKPVSEDDVPEAVQDSIVAKRGALLASAKAVLPAEVKLDGLPAAEIRRQVVAHAMPTIKLDGLDEKIVGGMFLAVTASADAQKAQRADSQKALAGVVTPTAEQAAAVAREDGAPVNHTRNLQSRFEKLGQDPLSTPKAG